MELGRKEEGGWVTEIDGIRKEGRKEKGDGGCVHTR